MKNLPLQIKIIVLLLVITILGSIVNSFSGLYNKSIEFDASYAKIKQEQVSNYDGYYLAFLDKQTNANINKETFIQVTDIIMSNRKDGQSVSWKWVQENQQIPYHEFTVFYKELSLFISERYIDNMRIENNKQSIVEQQNKMLKIWPNNLYNKVLNIEPLKYKAGYISDYTKNKFN